MAEALQVELVAADRMVWSGEASMVIARTVEGELGILRGHTPVLSLLAPSVVEIRPREGQAFFASVDGGFISVANDRISILSEHTALGEEIDLGAARSELESARADAGDEPDGQMRVRTAEARVHAAEKAS